MEDSKKVPKVFISYSWTSSERVVELATRLMSNGIEVILDKWDLKEGHDKYAFMEQSVNNPDVDKVLIICDKAYAEKANNREGGVGDETVIISPEIYNSVVQEKFIPIVFEVDEDAKLYIPSYIKSRIYIDLSSEENGYEKNYESLLRNIFNEPLYQKPALGKKPEWLNSTSVDLSSVRDLIKQIRGYIGGNKTKADFLIRKCNDEFIIALMSYELNRDLPKDEAILALIDEEKPLRDLYIDYIEAIIYSELPIGEIIPSFIEQIYNSNHDASSRQSYRESDFEVYDFIVWELFICTTAVLLHYERYKELKEILTHSFFLRESYSSEVVTEHTYNKFRAYCSTIEEVAKPKSESPRVYSLTAEILVKREKKPLITKKSLSNADVILYQLYEPLDLSLELYYNSWFPTTYHYCGRGGQPIWYKLKSKTYCKKIMPLFGVETIEELKNAVSKCKADREMRHSGSFESVPVILSSISIDEIGSIN